MKGFEHQRAIALACVAALFLPSAASAARDRRGSILVLRLESEEVPPELLKQLDAATRAQVGSSVRGVKLLRQPALDFDSLRVAASCADDGPACLAAIGTTLGAAQVLRVVLAREGKDMRVTFHRTWVKDKRGMSTTAVIADFDADAIPDFRGELAKALGDRSSPPLAPARIALEAPAHDANALEEIQIFVDDYQVPLNGLGNLTPGEHKLEIDRLGYKRFTRTLTLRAGRKSTVVVEFEALPAEVAREEPVATREAPPKVLPTLTPELKPTGRSAIATPMKAEMQQEPKVFYTWFLAGGAAVATGVGIAFYAQQKGIEDRLSRDQTIRCDAEPKPADCKKGERTELATYIAFPAAGLLGAAAITTFFLEGGLGYFRSDARGEASASFSGAIVPLADGLAASVTGRY